MSRTNDVERGARMALDAAAKSRRLADARVQLLVELAARADCGCFAREHGYHSPGCWFPPLQIAIKAVRNG